MLTIAPDKSRMQIFDGFMYEFFKIKGTLTIQVKPIKIAKFHNRVIIYDPGNRFYSGAISNPYPEYVCIDEIDSESFVPFKAMPGRRIYASKRDDEQAIRGIYEFYEDDIRSLYEQIERDKELIEQFANKDFVIKEVE